MMGRRFIKESILGTIIKEMHFGLYCIGKINTVCICRGHEEYTGTIPAHQEHALALEWKQAGFQEIPFDE